MSGQVGKYTVNLRIMDKKAAIDIVSTKKVPQGVTIRSWDRITYYTSFQQIKNSPWVQ